MNLDNIIDTLINNAYKRKFIGFDPYDFAHSKFKFPNFILSKLSFLNKILPYNFRCILGIKKTDNTKSNALFLYAMSIYNYNNNIDKIDYLNNWLIAHKSNEFEEFSLGFAFEMALSRYASGPGKTSLFITLVTMCAFLEYYNKSKDPIVLEKINSFKYLLDNKWLKFENDTQLSVSYLSDTKDEVYNISAMSGKFYAMYYTYFPNQSDKIKIQKILNYLQDVQNEDGSWMYSSKARYVDHFHTCFIIESIIYMHKIASSPSSILMYNKAISNYETNCFKSYQPLHYNNKRQPKDIRRFIFETEIRDIANAIIIFSLTGKYKRASKVIEYSLDKYYNNKNGYFYFYHNKLYKSKINYIRCQAWMALALSTYLLNRPK